MVAAQTIRKAAASDTAAKGIECSAESYEQSHRRLHDAFTKEFLDYQGKKMTGLALDFHKSSGVLLGGSTTKKWWRADGPRVSIEAGVCGWYLLRDGEPVTLHATLRGRPYNFGDLHEKLLEMAALEFQIGRGTA